MCCEKLQREVIRQMNAQGYPSMAEVLVKNTLGLNARGLLSLLRSLTAKKDKVGIADGRVLYVLGPGIAYAVMPGGPRLDMSEMGSFLCA